MMNIIKNIAPQVNSDYMGQSEVPAIQRTLDISHFPAQPREKAIDSEASQTWNKGMKI